MEVTGRAYCADGNRGSVAHVIESPQCPIMTLPLPAEGPRKAEFKTTGFWNING
jgi:hypothetical protein